MRGCPVGKIIAAGAYVVSILYLMLRMGIDMDPKGTAAVVLGLSALPGAIFLFACGLAGSFYWWLILVTVCCGLLLIHLAATADMDRDLARVLGWTGGILLAAGIVGTW